MGLVHKFKVDQGVMEYPMLRVSLAFYHLVKSQSHVKTLTQSHVEKREERNGIEPGDGVDTCETLDVGKRSVGRPASCMMDRRLKGLKGLKAGRIDARSPKSVWLAFDEGGLCSAVDGDLLKL